MCFRTITGCAVGMVRLLNPLFSDSRRLRNGWWIAIFMAILFFSLGALATVTRHQEIGIYQEAVLLVGATWLVQRLRGEPLTEVTAKSVLTNPATSGC